MHCWARDVARKPAEGVVICATGLAPGFELLAAETAGEQISGCVETAPGDWLVGVMRTIYGMGYHTIRGVVVVCGGIPLRPDVLALRR